MKPRRLLALLAIPALLLAGCAGQEAERAPLTKGVDEAAKAALPQDIRDAGVLNVAVDYPYPPFASDDENGNPMGLDVDLAYALGEKLDIKVNINKQPFDTAVASLQANSNDIILSGMNDTLERQKTLDFIEYLHAGFAIAVPAGNPKGISEVFDLCGLTIASQKASTTGDILVGISEECKAAGKPEVKMHELATVPDSNTALQAGNVDGFIGDAPIMAFLAETSGDGKAVELLEFPELPKGFDPVFTGIGVLKSDEGLSEAILLAMKSIEEEGTYDELLKRSGLEQYRVERIDMNLAES